MNPPTIQQTKNYGMFKQLNFNRKKSKLHIKKLKEIISNENLLHLHPIIVNQDMEVVDGQHRLAVAQELGTEIYYLQEDVSYGHILNSNLYQRKMSLEDVIKFYAIKDRIPSYIYLQEWISETSISPKALIGLIFGVCSKPMIEFIKSGKFELPKNKERLDQLIGGYREFIKFVEEKRISPRSMFNSSYFTIALRNIISLNDFDQKTFFNKLEYRWFELRPQLNSKEFTKSLIAIYNWKNHNPIYHGAS